MSDTNLDSLLRGCDAVYNPQELKKRLEQAAARGRQLRVKLGMDPTAPDLHLGHTVVLQKMRQFQDLGHKAVLIMGDFTAKIGDPTGRSATRPVLTDDEINANAETYFSQAGKVLDMSPERLEIRRNSEWLGPMGFADVIRLTARTTVAQLLKRDDFRKRFESETPISVHELLYPLSQGWDSVQVRADVELGGTDQTYNNLVGRDLQVQEGQPPQIVMVMPLLRGIDGVQKMSKSYGNYIGVTDSPTDIFGKTMKIPDDLLEEWFTLLTDLPEAEWRAVIAEHPMKAKQLLAVTIGTRICKVGSETESAEQVMQKAADWWVQSFSEKKTAGDAVEIAVASEHVTDGKVAAWTLAWLAHDGALSKSEARRMVQGGAFTFRDEKITDPQAQLAAEDGAEFRAGRHRSGQRIKQPLLAVLRRKD